MTEAEDCKHGWWERCSDDGYDDYAIGPCPYCEIERLREALHLISLGSQNSMSNKEECGKIARKALQRAGGEE